jgi:hypothetical protein
VGSELAGDVVAVRVGVAERVRVAVTTGVATAGLTVAVAVFVGFCDGVGVTLRWVATRTR